MFNTGKWLRSLRAKSENSSIRRFDPPEAPPPPDMREAIPRYREIEDLEVKLNQMLEELKLPKVVTKMELCSIPDQEGDFLIRPLPQDDAGSLRVRDTGLLNRLYNQLDALMSPQLVDITGHALGYVLARFKAALDIKCLEADYANFVLRPQCSVKWVKTKNTASWELRVWTTFYGLRLVSAPPVPEGWRDIRTDPPTFKGQSIRCRNKAGNEWLEIWQGQISNIVYWKPTERAEHNVQEVGL